MIFPYLKGHSQKKLQTFAFGGLNKNPYSSVGEFAEMKNMSADKFPYLSPCAKKCTVQINSNIKNIQGFIAPGDKSQEFLGFTGVADGVFYYQNTPIPFAYSFMSIPEDEETELVNISDRIIIAPQMYCYEYKNTKKNKRVYPLPKGFYDAYLTVISASDNNLPITIKKDAVGKNWEEEGFAVGDSVMIETDDENYSSLNVYVPEDKYDRDAPSEVIFDAIIESITDFTMKVKLFNYDGRIINPVDSRNEYINHEFKGTLRVYKRFPKFKNICANLNRIWATTKDGESIYASAPGDIYEFSRYDGLSTDSWYTNVGDYGSFTGITAFRDGVVAFKESNIYHIYGDRPTNFSVAKRFSNCGCIDAKTVCETDTSVFFAGADDIYEYSGGAPIGIGKNLNIKNFSHGAAYANGKKYYLSLNGENKLFVYDRNYKLWHIEGDFDILGGVTFKNKLYFATASSILSVSDEYSDDWSATLCDITEQSMEHKGINDIFIRVQNGENSEISVWVSQNGGEFKLCGKSEKSGEYTFRVPVRFISGDKYSIKFSGKGSCIIKDIRRSFYIGGGAFTRKG